MPPKATPITPLRFQRGRSTGDGLRENARVNVGDLERLVSALAGGAMALSGLARGTPLGWTMALAGGALVHRGFTGHCYAYDALGVDQSRRPHGPFASVRAGTGVKVEKSYTIGRPAEELYRYWRNLENLPRFMTHLESVRDLGGGRSHWVAKGPLGMRVEWDAEIHNEEPYRIIAWRSLPGSEVDTAGSVHFEEAPADRGTVVRVVLKYDPPAARAGALVARLFGEAPEQQIQEDLRRFKRIMEAGEAPTTAGQASCRAVGL